MLTNEQHTIINTIQNGPDGIYLINSIAGSGKTKTAIELINTLEGVGYYLVFGKANAVEMRDQISNESCRVSTMHALAWHSGIPFKKPSTLNKAEFSSVSHFKQKLPETLLYTKRELTGVTTETYNKQSKQNVFKQIKDTYAELTYKLYSLSIQSKEIKIAENWDKLIKNMDRLDLMFYGIDNLNLIKPVAIDLVKNKFVAVTNKEEPIELGMLPKLLYQYLHFNRLSIYADYVIVDEGQDLTEADLGIIDKINAKKKIIIGDPFQSIFAFRGTGSAFDYYQDEGILLNLHKSFRVPTKTAVKIEQFGKYYLSDSFVFEGSEETPNTYKKAIIVRTRIAMMLYIYYSNHFKFRTIKPITEEFGPVLKALEFLNFPQNYFKNELPPDLNLLHALYLEWEEDAGEQDEILFKTYVKQVSTERENIPLIQLLKVNETIGLDKFNYLYRKLIQSNKEPDKTEFIIIGTAHSFKGFTVDEVIIDEGFKDYLKKTVALDTHANMQQLKYLNVSDKRKQEWLLYYVAVTRATKTLSGYTAPLELTLEELAESFGAVYNPISNAIPQFQKFNLYDCI